MRCGRLAVVLGIVLVVLCVSTAVPAAARTLVVAQAPDASTPGCDAPTPYTTIGDAVAVARPHDMVLVCRGTYAEQLTISTPLTLRGVAGAVVRPQGMVANTTSLTTGNALATVIVVNGVAGVTIEGLTIDGANNAITACPAGVPTPDLFGVFFRNASGAIRDSAIRNMRLGPGLEACGGGTGILVQSGAGGRSVVTIEGTSIHAFQRNGITANEAGTDVRIRRNVVTGLGPTAGAVQNGIQVARGATGMVEENVVTETISASCTAASCPSNGNNILLGSGSTGVRVTRNVLGRGQTGVAVFGHGNRVQDNVIFHTLVFDGIYVEGDDNDVHGNDVTRSDESGIFTVGSRNRVSNNRINEAPVGLLNAGVDNAFLHNTVLNALVPGPVAP